MTADGKMLEALVAFVEESSLPPGFDVKTNQKVRKENGVQIAEFDVEIRGKVGTTDIAWLIECRDRPSDGPQGGDWIEQLVGRRDRFQFHKVTAVSTTGFAEGARDYAKERGIELREVRRLAPEEFKEWLQIKAMAQVERRTMLSHAEFVLAPDERIDLIEGMKGVMRAGTENIRLKAIKTGNLVSLRDAFLTVVESVGNLFDGLESNGPAKTISIRANYTNDDDHFVIETPAGEVQIRQVVYRGDLCIVETLLPLAVTAEYAKTEGADAISQYAAFAPFTVQGASLSLEFHKMANSGETMVVIRSQGPAKTDG